METHPAPNTAHQPARHPMRRRDRELSQEEAENILKKAVYGILCTCGNDNMPYGVPVNYVYENGCIGFHCAMEGHKLLNLRENARAGFTVVGAAEVLPQKFSCLYESAIAFGKVTQAEGARKRDILQALIAKYSPEYLEKGRDYMEHDADRVTVLVLEVEQLSGKAHR